MYYNNSIKFVVSFLLILSFSVCAEVDPRFEHKKLSQIFNYLDFGKVSDVYGEWKLVGESYQKGSYQMSRIDPLGITINNNLLEKLHVLDGLVRVDLYQEVFNSYETNFYEIVADELFYGFSNLNNHFLASCKYIGSPIEMLLCNGSMGSGRTSYKCYVRSEIYNSKSCLFL